MDEVVDRRRARSVQTRHALEEAALRLVVDRGFDQTTIDDIACSAGVSARTFFRHFPSKEDVILGDQQERIGQLSELLAARPPDEPILTSVREAILGLADDDERMRDFRLIRARVAQETPSLRFRAAERRLEWEEVLASYVGRRLDSTPRDLRPNLIAGATIAALRTARERWVASSGAENMRDLADEALGLLDIGFGLD